ncbi:LAFE_0B09340g1_1 [Lachancea fermentati]|uniref:Serine/threonine-protein kinase Tel1 n=1 Tax=Lachancea fermentati TaxID=4955 RepID=A0A1G4M8F1_LACFM|nr:LAFE_0B09340g1_1 [Lachancea fermentati]
MESSHVSSTLELLSSSKLKERNKGLDELTTLLKQRPTIFQAKHLNTAIESLIGILEIERAKFIKFQSEELQNATSKTAAAENRLTATSYVLRLLIEKTNDRMRAKQMRFLVVMLPELMVIDDSLELLKPISQNILCALETLLLSDIFQLKFELHQWISLVKKMSNSLLKHLDHEVNDKNVSQLFKVLVSLISIDTIGIQDVVVDMVGPIMKYLRITQEENSNTKTLLQLVNRFVIKTYMTESSCCMKLIEATMAHLVSVQNFTGDGVEYEISIFTIFLSNIINHKLPVMVGASDSLFACDPRSLLQTYQDFLLVNLNFYRPEKLSLTLFEFGNIDNRVEWYELDDFQLCKNADPNHWLQIYGITKGVVAYYDLLRKCSTFETDQTTKKRKVAISLGSILKSGHSPIEFLEDCVANDKPSIQLFGLQFSAFFTSLSVLDAEVIKNLRKIIIQKFESDILKGWACLASVPLYSRRYKGILINDFCERLFKLCLPLIKSTELSKVSCALLTTLLELDETSLITDQSVVHQIYDVYELSEVNGPILVNNEAFSFWQHLHVYGKSYPSHSRESEGRRIFLWLLSKWSQLADLKSDQNELHNFVAWLSGSNSVTSVRSSSTYFKHFDKVYYPQWQKWQTEREFFLFQEEVVKPSSAFKSVDPVTTVEQNMLCTFLDQICIILEDSAINTETLSKWVGESIRIIDHLYGNTNFVNLVENFKNSVKLAIVNLNSMEINSISSFPFHAVADLKGVKYASYSLLSEFNVHYLITEFKNNFLSTESSSKLHRLDNFESSRKKNDVKAFSFIPDFLSRGFCENPLKSTTEFILNMSIYSSDLTLDDGIKTLLDFLTGMPTEYILPTVPPMVEHLANSKEEISITTLENLTHFLGSTLLSLKFNSSSISLISLSMFLESIRDSWLTSVGSLLNTDCNDIFEWIVSRFEDSTITSTSSLLCLSELMLQMLKKNDLSNGSVNGGKQRIFGIFIGCLTRLPAYMMISKIKEMQGYILKVSFKNQLIMFSAITELFKTPQESIENAAFYTFSLIPISSISYPLLVHSLLHMFQFVSYPHVRYYITYALRLISSLKNFEDCTSLFRLCRFDIINFWFQEYERNNYYDFDSWDVALFGFESIQSFVMEFRREISGFIFSLGYQKSDMLGALIKITSAQHNALLQDSLHLAIPLSYLKSGIGDRIFETCLEVLGKGFEKTVREIPLNLFYWFMRFADFGSIQEMRIVLQKHYHQSPISSSLFNSELDKHKYQFDLSIPFSKVLRTLKTHIREQSLHRAHLRFFLTREMFDLSLSTSIEETVRILRSIKLLLILFRDYLNDCDYLVSVVKTLSKFISKENLRDEIFSIICFLLDIYHDFQFNGIDMFPAIFAHLFLIQDVHDSLASVSLRETLVAVVSAQLSNLQYSQTWSFCIDALQGRKSEDVYLADELLDDDIVDSNRLLLLSQLFSFQPNPEPLSMTFHFSHRVVRNLICTELSDEKLSNNFYLWKGYYVGSFFLKNAHLPELLDSKNAWSDLENLLCDCDNFHGIIELLHNSLRKSQEPKLTYLYGSVIGLLTGASTDERGQHGHHYEDNSSKFAAISLQDFALFHGDLSLKEGSDDFLRRKHLSEITYNDWLLSLFFALTIDLQSFAPMAFALPVVAKYDLEFAEITILHMFLYLLSHEPRMASKLITNFLQSFVNFAKLKDLKDLHKKANVLFKLFFLIRAGAKRKVTQFVTLYSRLNLFEFYQLAMKIGQMEFSFMIFEELYLGNVEPLNFSSLSTIFSGLHDDDLRSSLPTVASLSFAISQANRAEPRSMKTFMFNNGQYDVDTLLIGKADTESLLKSISINGFKGLAEVVGDNTGALDDSRMDEIYQWSIELGKWDLPAPGPCDSRPKALYSLLRTVELYLIDVRDVIEDTLPLIARKRKHFSEHPEWASVLSDIATLSYFVKSLRDCEQSTLLLSCLKLSDIAFLRNNDFQDYQFTMKVRQVFLNLLGKDNRCMVSQPLVACCEVSELAKYCRLSRECGATQESITTAMLLDRVTKMREQEILGKPCRRVAVFEAAQVLWEQKENAVAISMLKSLLQQIGEEDEISVELQPMNKFLEVSDVKIKSLLVQWISASRQETAESIYKNYIASSQSEIFEVEDYRERSSIFYRFGDFCYEQVRLLGNNLEMEERQKRFKKGSEELQVLYDIVHDLKSSERERKEARKHYNRLKLQVEQDKEIVNNLSKQLSLFIWNSLHFYLNAMVYSNEKDDDVLDKFCGLWFQYSFNEDVNSRLYQEIGSIPSFKFLPWINQMTSRLGMENTSFQKTLQLTLKRVLFKLPYESLYSLISLKLHKRFDSAKDPSVSTRVRTAEKLLRELENYDNGKYNTEFVTPIEEFCDKCVDLASLLPPKRASKIDLENLKIGNYWLRQLGSKNLLLPTMSYTITCSADGRKPRPMITRVEETVEISPSGLSLPKIVTFLLSDGTRHKVLMKGSNDDLRQDAIMEQVFKQVNKILIRNKQTRRYGLRIRTYEVVPLGPQAGLIEFVSNSTSLHEILCKLHKDDNISFEQARKAMKSVQTKSNEDRLKEYRRITKSINPQFRRFFFESFPDPHLWLNAKLTYTKGVVTTSIIGYILGLGDRHLNNILIDKSTGEPIHIDLGVAFDQGRLLPIPELVPFRLTRDMIDGFGVVGVEGPFRKNAERVYNVLRKDYERVMSVLNVLKWDPLYSWVVSPLRKKKLQAHLADDSNDSGVSYNKEYHTEDNNESIRALKGVQEKLLGGGLSVEAIVQELIQQATDENNLAVIYMGWSPFY